MSNYTVELNEVKKDSLIETGRIKASDTVVEVFSAMVNGKDLGKFGKEADKCVNFIKQIGQRASLGDEVCKSELNALRRFIIEPILKEEIKLLSVFGSYKPLAYNDSAEVEVLTIANSNGVIQAAGQDVTTPVYRKKRVPIGTTTISGGYAVDYRKAALGDMSEENNLINDVRTDIRNKAAKYIIETVYNAIKNATGVKYVFEGAGLTKEGVDTVIRNVRKLGRVTVTGEYALLSQFNDFAGYVGKTPAINGISEAVMNEIHKSGLMGMYNGVLLQETPNPYDFTSLDEKGTNFKTLLPAGLGFVIPQGAQSPIHTVTRGGLTSCRGLDVTTGTELARFDLEVGALVVPGREFQIGMLHDKNLDDLATE